jgi:hypothetical protein
MTEALGTIYTFKEAAAKLRVSIRNFQGIIQRHPFYSKNGKVYLFSEEDLSNIWNGMQAEAEEKRRLVAYRVPVSEAALYQRLRELTGKKRRRRS